jgi:hypothetical protein
MNTRANYVLWGIGVVLLLGWAGMSLAASPPERINFQGVLRDASGAPVADGTYDMSFTFFGNGPGACDCGEAHATPGCTDATCEAEVCGIDSYCCDTEWDDICALEAEQFASCQACIANEEVLNDNHGGLKAVAVTGGLFNVALGSGSIIFSSLGELFRDFDVVYVEIQVNGEVLSPRIRVEASAYTQNALRLEGKRATEFLDTSATAQAKAGDLEVQGNVTVGGNVAFSDGSVLKSARPDPPCFDYDNRFADCGNGTVTDQVTGLIWLKDADCHGWADYPTANNHAASLGDGTPPACNLTDGSSPGDWRLPTVEEWQVIIDQAISNGCMEPGPFFPDVVGTGCCGTGTCAFYGVQQNIYWSASTYAPIPNFALAVNLAYGSIIAMSKTIVRGVWPVRDGQ